MPERVSRELSQARARRNEIVADRERRRVEAASLQAETARLQRLADQRQAVGDVDGALAARRGADAAADRRRHVMAGVAAADRELQAVIAAIAIDRLVADADVPVALLPVRIETRSTSGGATLRVRIYPDDIHVDAHERGLSAPERDAGVAYWGAIWDGPRPGAWEGLVAAVGPRRAEWVAAALTPTNLAARPGAAPAFPDTEAPGSGRPLARLLPDRFHVVADQGGVMSEGIGAPIPDELAVGLSVSEDDPPLADDELPPLDAAMRWMTDYDAAVAVGMGVSVPLARPGQRIDTLLVVGLRATLDPASAARELERLLESHRFARGAAFVPQGTPTNNTDAARAGWTRAPELREPAVPPAEPPGDSNAGALARALGISPAVLARYPHAADLEQREAHAMNTALWASTWGTLLSRLLVPPPTGPVSDRERADAREQFIAYVRGRGPLPAIRIGKQPYGILPVLPIDANSFRPLLGGTVEARLVPFLRRLRAVWQLGVENVPRVTRGDLDQELPEILGSSPVLQGLRVRSVLASLRSYSNVFPMYDEDPNRQAQLDANRIAMELVEIVASKVNDNGLLGDKTRWLGLPLADAKDPAFIQALIDESRSLPAPTSLLQVLLGHATLLERKQRQDLASPSEVERLGRFVVSEAALGVDRELVARATAEIADGVSDAGAVREAAATIAARVGPLDRDGLAARQPFATLAASSAFAAITDEGRNMPALAADGIGLKLIGDVFGAYHGLERFRRALETLRGVEPAEARALLLSETLDLASHRLDAWVTSIATARLAALRRQPGGIQLGAFGWVEGLELVEPAPVQPPPGVQGPVFANPRDGGYVHAPSLTHAATAGVLRSGRLTHRQGDANHPALDIDLSSGRVREALAVIEGIRQGQPLGALLGYRLERWLHDRSGEGLELDRFVYVLRGLAPLVAGKATDRGASAEAVAASDVVDGVRLREISWSTVAAALSAGPQDKTYIVSWSPPTPAESEAVRAAIEELERVYDAVADVLLAEGVHQLVKGNPARAAAALDAIGGGEAAPPEPDVVRTPRSGVAFTHRLMLVVSDPPPPPRPGWHAEAPRAKAEPRLEAWAQEQLGDAGSLVLSLDSSGQPRRTLADAGLCALDVIYDADGADLATSSLGGRLRRAIPDLGGETQPFAQAWELARTLRAVLAAGRPALPDLFGKDRAIGTELHGRAEAALQSLADALAGLGNDPEPPAVLKAMAPFGLGGAAGTGDIAGAARAALQDAVRRRDAAAKLLDPPAATTPQPAPEQVPSRVLATIFGPEFAVLPAVAPAPDEFAAALGPAGVRPPDGGAIRPWLVRAAAVRPAVQRYGDAILYREARGTPVRLRVAQTPAGAAPRWIGLSFPMDELLPGRPLTGTVFEAAFGRELAADQTFAALVIDEWTDVVPRRIERRTVDDGAGPARIEAVTTTGVAVNCNGPNARAPQAVLLAISPDGEAWTKAKLVHALRDTMLLARERAVSLERVPWAGRILPALYFQDWALQGEPVIDFAGLSKVTELSPLRYVSGTE